MSNAKGGRYPCSLCGKPCKSITELRLHEKDCKGAMSGRGQNAWAKQRRWNLSRTPAPPVVTSAP